MRTNVSTFNTDHKIFSNKHNAHHLLLSNKYRNRWWAKRGTTIIGKYDKNFSMNNLINHLVKIGSNKLTLIWNWLDWLVLSTALFQILKVTTSQLCIINYISRQKWDQHALKQYSQTTNISVFYNKIIDSSTHWFFVNNKN